MQVLAITFYVISVAIDEGYVFEILFKNCANQGFSGSIFRLVQAGFLVMLIIINIQRKPVISTS